MIKNNMTFLLLSNFVQPHAMKKQHNLDLLYFFKSTGGVTRDPFYLFNISAVAEFLSETPKISAFEPKISSFLHFLGSLGTCVTAWRFDRGPSDA
jgi:hypothetical protein